MDLLVGVLCEDGVVVGSADSGTAGAGGSGSVEEASTTTFVVGRDVILAGAGRGGLAQRFAEVVTAIRSDSRFQNWTGLGVAKSICTEAIDDFASTRCGEGQFGALLAFPACDGFQLCEFAAKDLQPELKSADRWFAAMGTGRSAAGPLLAFLERVFFSESRPRLSEGVFAATWALDYVVGLSSGVVPGAPQIGVLAGETPGMPLAARLLSARELADSLAGVRAAEKHLAAYRRSLSSGR